MATGDGGSKIYTRTGDRGDTSLHYFERPSRASPRVEAYGTADEVGSALARGKELPTPELVRYLNRLSDAIYALVRYEGEDAEQVWREADVQP